MVLSPVEPGVSFERKMTRVRQHETQVSNEELWGPHYDLVVSKFLILTIAMRNRLFFFLKNTNHTIVSFVKQLFFFFLFCFSLTPNLRRE